MEKQKIDKLLRLLEQSDRFSHKDLAAMLEVSEAQIAEAIEDCEKKKIICGYKALIDWDKTDRDYVIARIELKVVPKHNMGFEDIAKTVAKFHEVQTVYLMSGGYDLAITVAGKTFKDVAMFVAHRLSPLESVQSTATSFVLRKYKERNVVMVEDDVDERGVASL